MKRATAKKTPFESSKRDVEKKGIKEGSKKDMRLDSRQKRKH